MAKLGLLASVSTLVGALTFAMIRSTPTAEAGDACKAKEFKTVLVKEACAKGGQKEAKAVMKAWMKEKKLKSCNECHSQLAPNYTLKPDGLEQFKKLGGK
jgi:hypothetical protein